MTLPFSLGTVPLPDWMPPWLPLVLAIPALLYALLVIGVPFSVFGLRARLDGIEERLDEIQGEIRALSLRLPAADDEVGMSMLHAVRPPVPPARERVRHDEAPDPGERLRADPRIEWPR